MRILCVHAHPDDIEFLAAGTLTLLAQAGHEITMSTMTAGDCGSAEFDPPETARIRAREAEESAKIIGAAYRCVGFQDMAIFNDDPARRRVTEFLREQRPEVVITASPIDYHTDHEATSVLVRDACFCASAPNYRTGGAAAPLDAIPHLYFTDSMEGLDREGRPQLPDFFVDVEPVMETKRRMLACHASQRNWLKRQHGMDDYIAQMEKWTAENGKRAGTAFAEGFRRYPAHPYPQQPKLERAVAEFRAAR